MNNINTFQYPVYIYIFSTFFCLTRFISFLDAHTKCFCVRADLCQICDHQPFQYSMPKHLCIYFWNFFIQNTQINNLYTVDYFYYPASTFVWLILARQTFGKYCILFGVCTFYKIYVKSMQNGFFITKDLTFTFVECSIIYW